MTVIESAPDYIGSLPALAAADMVDLQDDRFFFNNRQNFMNHGSGDDR